MAIDHSACRKKLEKEVEIWHDVLERRTLVGRLGTNGCKEILHAETSRMVTLIGRAYLLKIFLAHTCCHVVQWLCCLCSSCSPFCRKASAAFQGPKIAMSGVGLGFGHFLQNASLILLSLLFLPLDTSIVCFSLFISHAFGQPSNQNCRKQDGPAKDTFVLVTGVGMTKGLALARLFYLSGYRVIGADFKTDGALACGRVSKSLFAFYSLRPPNSERGSSSYADNLVAIIKKHNVKLWVSCSGVASAIEDAEAQEAIAKTTKCKAIQFDVQHTSMLHEKHSLIKHIKSLQLTVPETYTVTSRAAAEKILLHLEKDKKFIIKCVGVDDLSRADMTLFPRPTPEETTSLLNQSDISPENPWIIQQYIHGKEYCTHSLVIRGQVKAFVACPSSELLMHYESLPALSPLSRAMLDFTKTVAQHGGPDFTGHMSFDFMVEDEQEVVLYPIECNPRAHTAVALFNDTPAMVDAYMSLFDSENGTSNQDIVTPVKPKRYYWVGHDLVTQALIPLLNTMTLRGSLSGFLQGLYSLCNLWLWWKDGTFEYWDPLPWWWLYHVYWPMKFLDCLLHGKRWSRINVSTTKMFMS